MSVAGEREQGTLAYLMAQPINQAEMLLGKFLGLTLALFIALGIGFGITGLLIAYNGSQADAGTYVTLVLLAFLLAVVSLSLGFLISAAVQRATTAISIALFLWLVLVFFGDLGLMGTALVMRIDISQLFFMSLLNPLQLFKIAAVLDLRQNLEVLGPAGIYATRTFGDNLLPMLIGLLLAWIVVPFAGTTVFFKRRGVL
jgi:Cu-processing system permease protein